MFGRLIFGLCCSNMAAVNNLPKSLETMSKHYSADVKNVALFCLGKVGVHKVRSLYGGVVCGSEWVPVLSSTLLN